MANVGGQSNHMPNPVRLFHITAIDNLADICREGALLCKNNTRASGINYQNIAYAGAQGARSVRLVPDPPGGTIHDFVPFYFAPRSPMLGAINKGNVKDCHYRQSDILYFETVLPNVLDIGADYVFYDRNATVPYSAAFTDIGLLSSKVAWDLLTEGPRLDGFCKYFHNVPTNDRYIDRMERRLAEFLIKHRVPLSCMTRIGVIDAASQSRVQAILANSNVNLRVEIKTDWYFLGQ